MTARNALLLCGALLLPAACGHSPPTRFLTLDATPGTGGGAGYRGPAIRVPAVRIPPDLDRDEFVQKVSPGELKVEDLVHWSGSLGMLARNTLILDLSSRLPAGKVSPPDAPAQSGGVRIDVSVMSLDVAAGTASLQAAYAFAADDGQAPASYRQWITLQAPSGGGTAVETARAFSALLGQLADRITMDLATKP
jgi:uncharacterized lipoprotein YmbA